MCAVMTEKQCAMRVIGSYVGTLCYDGAVAQEAFGDIGSNHYVLCLYYSFLSPAKVTHYTLHGSTCILLHYTGFDKVAAIPQMAKHDAFWLRRKRRYR